MSKKNKTVTDFIKNRNEQAKRIKWLNENTRDKSSGKSDLQRIFEKAEKR